MEGAKVKINMDDQEIIITPTEIKKFEPNATQATKDEAGSVDHEKITIKGPGSYIKKLIQQFSEATFDGEEPIPEPEKAVQKPASIKDRAEAICNKCFHYKGKSNK